MVGTCCVEEAAITGVNGVLRRGVAAVYAWRAEGGACGCVTRRGPPGYTRVRGGTVGGGLLVEHGEEQLARGREEDEPGKGV